MNRVSFSSIPVREKRFLPGSNLLEKIPDTSRQLTETKTPLPQFYSKVLRGLYRINTLDEVGLVTDLQEEILEKFHHHHSIGRFYQLL